MSKNDNNPILQIQNVKKYFPVTAGIIFDRVTAYVKALDGVDLTLGRLETVGLVGESGSGKSTLGKLILLLENPTDGRIFFDGSDISQFDKKTIQVYREKVQAVFQDPFSSLSPRQRLRFIISEPLAFAGDLNKSGIEERVAESLRLVKLDPSMMKLFPHELSGGQRQRVAIARAISTNAKLIILDEPTSSLDVSVRLQIVDLLMDLQQKLGLSYFLIGHDLALVAYMSVRIAVMYLGKIVEFAETEELLRNTHHPYTKALISASLPHHPQDKKVKLKVSGEIANPFNIPSGCRFHPRCTEKEAICADSPPPYKEICGNHWVACHF